MPFPGCILREKGNAYDTSSFLWFPFCFSPLLASSWSHFPLVLSLILVTALKIAIEKHFFVQNFWLLFFFPSQVIVLIEESVDFDVLMSSNDVNDTTYQQTALVPSEDGVTLLFPIKPTQLGEIPITVKAASPTASDAITQKVLVKVNIGGLDGYNGSITWN